MTTVTELDRSPADTPDALAHDRQRIPLSEISSPVLLHGLALWRSLCGGRRYPPRDAVTPRALKGLMRNTTLLRVIDGGRDYKYRIVGDAYVMAHGRSYQGLLWSETAVLSRGYHDRIKPVYDHVVQQGEPLATRGWIERGDDRAGQIYCEYVFLPLGEDGVDHILVFAVYTPCESENWLNGLA
jgi:hypothetical protein